MKNLKKAEVFNGIIRFCQSQAFLFFVLLSFGFIVNAAGLFHHIFNPDEADLSVVADSMLRGVTLYKDLMLIKPPLGYLAWAVIFEFIAHDLRAVHAVLIVTNVLTAFFILRLTMFFVSRWAGVVAGFATILFTSAITFSANTETLGNLPIVLCVYLLVIGVDKRSLLYIALGGLCAGVASLIKQQSGLIVLPFVFWLLFQCFVQKNRGWWIRASLIFGFAVGLPNVGVLFYYYLHDALNDYIYSVFLFGKEYSSQGSHCSLQCMKLLLGKVVYPLLPIWLGGFFLFVLKVIRIHRWSKYDWLILVWVMSTAAAIMASFRMYDHYFIYMVPIGALSLGYSLNWLWKNVRSRSVFVFVCLLLSGMTLFTVVDMKRDVERLKRSLIEHESFLPPIRTYISRFVGPDEKVLPWGRSTAINYFTERPIATRYILPTLLIKDDPCRIRLDGWPHNQINEAFMQNYIHDLKKDLPALIVDMSKYKYGCWRFPLTIFPAMKEFVDEYYDPPIKFVGFVLYHRKGETPSEIKELIQKKKSD